jgi:hypothetical protein
MGNLAWAEELQWAGKDAFNNSTISFVLPDGQLGGDGKTAKVGDKGRLTFLKIFGAGHMVRYIDLHACFFACFIDLHKHIPRHQRISRRHCNICLIHLF